MGSSQYHRGGSPVPVGAEPVAGRDAPPIPGLEAGELESGYRCDQVVADISLVLEEIPGDHGTNRVATQVLRRGLTGPISEPTGDRIDTAPLQVAAEDIAGGHENTTTVSIPTTRQ